MCANIVVSSENRKISKIQTAESVKTVIENDRADTIKNIEKIIVKKSVKVKKEIISTIENEFLNKKESIIKIIEKCFVSVINYGINLTPNVKKSNTSF